jgi:ABC-type nitrate/sulfonate/bicarbonate transport system permease component
LLAIVGGYLIALAFSLPLAVALFGSPLLSRAIYPLLIIKQSVPVVALAPILIVILGSGQAIGDAAPSRSCARSDRWSPPASAPWLQVRSA